MQIIVVMPSEQVTADNVQTVALGIQTIKGRPFNANIPGGIKNVVYQKDVQVGDMSAFAFGVEAAQGGIVNTGDIVVAYMDIHRSWINWEQISHALIGQMEDTHHIVRSGRRHCAPEGHETLFVYEPISVQERIAPRIKPGAPIIVNNMEVDPDFEGQVSPFNQADIEALIPELAPKAAVKAPIIPPKSAKASLASMPGFSKFFKG